MTGCHHHKSLCKFFFGIVVALQHTAWTLLYFAAPAAGDCKVTTTAHAVAACVCRDCPTGQITSSNSARFPNSASYFVRNPDGSGGFVSVKACVNLPGYGYNGKISEQCPTGSYSAGDSNGACVSCPEGFTTAGPGVGVTEADCGVAAGYGNVNGTIRPCRIGELGCAVQRCQLPIARLHVCYAEPGFCPALTGAAAAVDMKFPTTIVLIHSLFMRMRPAGTYNPVLWSPGTNVTCTPCPALTTTAQEGTVLADGCSLCVPGYGGDKCMTQCGGVGPLAVSALGSAAIRW